MKIIKMLVFLIFLVLLVGISAFCKLNSISTLSNLLAGALFPYLFYSIIDLTDNGILSERYFRSLSFNLYAPPTG